MVFKANQGKRVMFTFDKMVFRSENGLFETKDKDIISFLEKNQNWSKVGESSKPTGSFFKKGDSEKKEQSKK